MQLFSFHHLSAQTINITDIHISNSSESMAKVSVSWRDDNCREQKSGARRMLIPRSRFNKRSRGDLITFAERRHRQSNRNENFAAPSRLLITGLGERESEESLAVSHSPAKTVIPKRARSRYIIRAQPNSIERLFVAPSGKCRKEWAFAPPRGKFPSRCDTCDRKREKGREKGHYTD